jgi:hypothetical protein
MRFRIRSKSRKNLLLISIILFLFVIVNLEHVRVSNNKLFYELNDIFEYYFRRVDQSLPEFTLSSENDANTNKLCLMPVLNYKEKLAMQFLDSDFASLKSTIEMCEKYQPQNEQDGFVLEHLIKREFVSINQTHEAYLINLNVKMIEKKFDLSRKNLKCFMNRFDKKINVSEEYEDLEMFEPISEFNETFELVLKVHGFYYLKCFKSYFSRRVKLIDHVYAIYPRNMSILVEQRRSSYGKHVEDFKKSFKNKTTQALLENSYAKENCADTRSKTEQKMNVLIIGIDSVSANHFKRVFPKTFAYLNEDLENNVIFDHFNSAGFNTFPNIVPMLTGLIEEGSDELNLTKEMDFFRQMDSTYHDHLPFIWQEYEKQNYVTIFQEDQPDIAIFNYYKNGFRYWPTSVYGRPFWSKYYKIRSGPDKCHYTQPSYLTWLNQIEQFIENMNTPTNKRTGYFSFNFLTEYTHSYLAVPPRFDLKLSHTLRSLESKGYLDNTMLIVMSDHGNRLKFFAYATETGKLERFLPFLSIKLPKKLTNTRHLSNLKKNKHRLVSFYDLYQTLRQFLFINTHGVHEKDSACSEQFYVNKKEDRNFRGISLLEQVPRDRSCEDAYIPNRECNCFSSKEISEEQFKNETSETFHSASVKILHFVNKLTESERSKCEPFRIKQIISFKKMLLNKFNLYVSVLIMEPGDAWFETNLKLRNSRHRVLEIYKVPNRISAYGNQSYCVNNSFLENYCFCKVQKSIK